MLLNGFNSDDYIYLKLNNDVKNKTYDVKKGEVLRFKRSELMDSVFSRLIFQGIYDHLEFVKKDNVNDNEILPHQVNSKIYFKEDARASLCLWPKERFCLNDWVINHLINSQEVEINLWGPCEPRSQLNMNALQKGVSKTIAENGKPPVIEIGNKNIDLIFTFEKGEELDFTDPGVCSFFIDRSVGELLLNSHALVGQEKLKLFEEDYKNAFFATDGIFTDDRNIFRYYKINDDVKVKNNIELPYIHVHGCSVDEEGYLRYVYLEAVNWTDFSKSDEQIILKFATEVPVEEAKEMHFKRLEIKKKAENERIEAWRKERAEKERKLNELFEQKRNDSSIFPGMNGNFVQNTIRQRYDDKKVTLEEVKEFFRKLKTIDADVLKQMYFYGGTLPYILNDEIDAREFGDIDIFVPVSQMERVREELLKQSSFHITFDSKDLTSQYNLTSKVPKTEVAVEDKIADTLEFLSAMTSDDNVIDEYGQNALESYFTKKQSTNRVFQDFGFKGSLFGVNISIFPIYQYEKDLMAKSFNISDVYQYLLAVRVMNNTNIDDFARNVKVYDSNINILPLEYTLVSKESAISDGYLKRETKDMIDVEYIMNHMEELNIDQEYLEKLKKDYPDYSIAVAYYLANRNVTKISGEKYKEMMLTNKGRWLS